MLGVASEDEAQVNVKFNSLGYSSTNFIINLGTIFFTFFFILLLLALSLLCKLLVKKNKLGNW